MSSKDNFKDNFKNNFKDNFMTRAVKVETHQLKTPNLQVLDIPKMSVELHPRSTWSAYACGRRSSPPSTESR